MIYSTYYFFSLITGEIVNITKEEIDLLENYQLPMEGKPRDNCKCFGRGYISIDAESKIYNPCKCVLNKVIKDKVSGPKIDFFLPLTK